MRREGVFLRTAPAQLIPLICAGGRLTAHRVGPMANWLTRVIVLCYTNGMAHELSEFQEFLLFARRFAIAFAKWVEARPWYKRTN